MHPSLSPPLGILAAVTMLLCSTFDFEPELQRRTEHRAHLIHTQLDEQYAEAYERVMAHICKDYWAGSQVVRVQNEMKAQGITAPEVCRP